MLLSVVITVRNEERNIGPLLDSLVIQEQPLEVLVVDAFSEDRTRQIVRQYSKEYDFIDLLVRGGTRGRSRNFGVRESRGEAVAFIDGDCIANPFWVKRFRERLASGASIVAGRTVQIGYRPFEELERVELHYRGSDVTFPSCNLAYRREAFEAVDGFDERFVTAEDVDMNLRAVEAGYSIKYEPLALVYHRTRGSYYDFFRQAFWNGAGRKQLTSKHGVLWGNYQPLEMIKHGYDFWSVARLSLALLGYMGYKMFGPRMGTLGGRSPREEGVPSSSGRN